VPSSSKKQHNFMEAIANNPKFAKKVGVPQSVGKDFEAADKGKKFSSGGQNSAELQTINKKKTNHGATALFKEGGMASSGAKIQKEMNKQLPKGISKQGIMPESKSMGMLGMKKGGKAEARMMPAKMEKVKDTMSAKKGAPKEQSIGSAKMGKVTRMGFAKGGGIEAKGKTKGKVC
jgi:hypothetical protein